MLLNKKCENLGYYKELPLEIQELIQKILEEHFNKNILVDTWGQNGSFSIDEIECERRDGFIPHSFNKGGIEIKGFSDLFAVWGSGYYPKNKKSLKAIEKTIYYSLDCAKESFFEHNKEILNKYKLSLDDINYHDLKDSKYDEIKSLAEKYSEYEDKNLQGDYSTIMYSIRFMYHGKDSKGIHTASISAAINTEAPYHRQHYDDNSKEIEISWRKESGLKTKLIKALKFVCGEVF